MKIFLVAGEISGDQLGFKLMRALRAINPDVELLGVGGPAMRAEGLASLFPLDDIAVMGFLPVLARLPQLLARIDETARAVVAARPDALVIIDSPDFTHRVAKRARKSLPALKVVDYVSPTVWAWRPGRAKAMRRYIDLVLALLPFEPAAHERFGGPRCLYVGHPLIERLDELRGPGGVSPPGARAGDEILVLPGSRRSVIARMGPLFGAAIAQLKAAQPRLNFLLPTPRHFRPLIEDMVRSWPTQPQILDGEEAKYAAFRRARAALAASGTVTLELALAGVPTVVSYKVSKIEEFVVRRMVHVSSIVLPNLILGENLYAELLQDDANPPALASALERIVAEGEARRIQLAGLQRLKSLMTLSEGERPSARAAHAIVSLIGSC